MYAVNLPEGEQFQADMKSLASLPDVPRIALLEATLAAPVAKEDPYAQKESLLWREWSLKYFYSTLNWSPPA